MKITFRTVPIRRWDLIEDRLDHSRWTITYDLGNSIKHEKEFPLVRFFLYWGLLIPVFAIPSLILFVVVVGCLALLPGIGWFRGGELDEWSIGLVVCICLVMSMMGSRAFVIDGIMKKEGVRVWGSVAAFEAVMEKEWEKFKAKLK